MTSTIDSPCHRTQMLTNPEFIISRFKPDAQAAKATPLQSVDRELHNVDLALQSLATIIGLGRLHIIYSTPPSVSSNSAAHVG